VGIAVFMFLKITKNVKPVSSLEINRGMDEMYKKPVPFISEEAVEEIYKKYLEQGKI
jgi:hypothetical protein